MNRSQWAVILLAVAALALPLGAVVGQYRAAGYVTPSVTLPLYGAGFTEGAGAAPADDDRLKRIEERLDRLAERLDRLLKALEDEPATAAAPPQELVLRPLPKEDETVVARKVERGQMPPPESGKLPEAERAAVSAAYRGKEFDKDVLARAVQACVACHSPGVDYKKKGGGFLLFEPAKK